MAWTKLTGIMVLVDRPHQITVVRRQIRPDLRGSVAGMVGLSERAAGTVRRRQPAGSLLPLVLSFGDPLRVTDLSEGSGGGRLGSFVSGLGTGYANTEFDRRQDCVQVYLSPTTVGTVLGVPGKEIARQVVPVGEIVPAWGRELGERLASATTWEARFDLVEAALLGQLASRGTGPPAWVTWMWQQIRSTGGQARIGELVERTGWSHRHVTSVFTAHVGLGPKQLAGVVRFERACHDLGNLPFAEVAARHGYADQSHLHRAVSRYAGETPQELAAAARPTAWTALGARPDRHHDQASA